jgi:2-polyprenyl-3-methyl-5-hydroxy-6-metoxy-1,4-benzoquinol methylase
MRVLDLACGRGCHAIAAAQHGATVVAVDRDPDRLREAEEDARRSNVKVQWIEADLTRDPIPQGPYDLVMQFNYLDRTRLSEFMALVKPGGYFEAETFLEQQRELGWGPTSDEHLLKRGELWTLAAPFEIVLIREVLEILDGRTRALASLLARRPTE